MVQGPSIVVPEVVQYVVYLLSELQLLSEIDHGLAFNKWLLEAKKTTGGSLLSRHTASGSVTFPLLSSGVVPSGSKSGEDQSLVAKAVVDSNSSLVKAQQSSISTFIRLLVSTLSEKGFPISTESAIPANTAAIIADQANVIKVLQQSLADQDKEYQAQIQLLELQLLQGAGTHSSPSPGRVSPPPVAAHNNVEFEAKFQSMKQEAVKLKNTNVILQKDLSASQRNVAELNQRIKENGDTIDSLEIAFAALKTVQQNERDDYERREGMKQSNADALIARLAKLTALQGEQLLLAEESRSRTQRQHIEELDRISVAHSDLIFRLQDEIAQLRQSVSALSERNRDIMAYQSEITGRQADTLAVLMRNNAQIVEKQYRPRNLVIQITEDDRKRMDQNTMNRQRGVGSVLVGMSDRKRSECETAATFASAIRGFSMPSKPLSARPNSASTFPRR